MHAKLPKNAEDDDGDERKRREKERERRANRCTVGWLHRTNDRSDERTNKRKSVKDIHTHAEKEREIKRHDRTYGKLKTRTVTKRVTATSTTRRRRRRRRRQ